MKYYKLIPILFIFLFLGCEDEPDLNPDGFQEFGVNIDGEWKVIQVLQNDKDITNLFDFQTFSLHMNYDNGQPSNFSYPDLSAPFSLKENSGTWSFDDPTYPKKINFSDGTILDIKGALLSNGNTMTITTSLGCTSNTYTYLLTKS